MCERPEGHRHVAPVVSQIRSSCNLVHSAAPKGAGYPAKELSSKQKSSSRPASAVKKKILQARPVQGGHHLKKRTLSGACKRAACSRSRCRRCRGHGRLSGLCNFRGATLRLGGLKPIQAPEAQASSCRVVLQILEITIPDETWLNDDPPAVLPF